MFNSLLEIPLFKEFFSVADEGIWAGIVTSMYQIGSVVAIPFIGPAIDTFGRKMGMVIGSVFIVVGTVIQGTTISNASVGQFMGGRFLLGFGVAIVASAGPMYVVEVSHPAFRSVMTAIYNCFW
jgi:MFS family permease